MASTRSSRRTSKTLKDQTDILNETLSAGFSDKMLSLSPQGGHEVSALSLSTNIENQNARRSRSRSRSKSSKDSGGSTVQTEKSTHVHYSVLWQLLLQIGKTILIKLKTLLCLVRTVGGVLCRLRSQHMYWHL